ncbi:hypothetical protein [Nitrobacter hamburgensis]|uniref:hypothetical protein n=1 Tax=Nitrobacter hamburgensis TaxID=912 RepID=UPI0012EE2F87|nr:hypothetical protein [Nitrobacter hamburgensis]
MIRRSLYGVLVVVLSFAGTSAWAQTRGSHISDRDIKTEQPVRKSGLSAQKSCSEFGPGFVRVEGSSSCMRIGGSIGVDAGTRR